MDLSLGTCGQIIDLFDATSVSRDHTSPVIVGQNILIVEDQALIALDMEGLLLGLGARECWLVPSVFDALKLLEKTKLTLAVVDFNLGHETSESVADRLDELAVPFVFFTGYGDRLSVPDRFAGVPIVSKPVITETLLLKIAQAQARSGLATGILTGS
jgi:CheY-like chemotaxis protein